MRTSLLKYVAIAAAGLEFWKCFTASPVLIFAQTKTQIGREVAIARHLEDDEEFRLSIKDLLAYGQKLFTANWTEQEGGGRPLSKGTGKQLTDLGAPLTGKR